MHHDVSTVMPRGTSDQSSAGDKYTPPAREDVHEVSSDKIGVTNGLFLKFPMVYAVGDLSLIGQPGVAVVGARDAGEMAMKRAAQLARDLVNAGIVVISGLAAGIDRAAHEAAIQHGGRTIAVIGSPIDKVYPPQHARLQEEIYRNHLLISPFRWGDRFFPSNFPDRNRLMARMARATVIIEAGNTSGSLHQAAESVLVGHPVFVAESAVNNPANEWPKRFVGKPHGYVLRSSSDVIKMVKG